MRPLGPAVTLQLLRPKQDVLIRPSEAVTELKCVVLTCTCVCWRCSVEDSKNKWKQSSAGSRLCQDNVVKAIQHEIKKRTQQTQQLRGEEESWRPGHVSSGSVCSKKTRQFNTTTTTTRGKKQRTEF